MVTESGQSGFSIKELPSEKLYDWLNSNLTSTAQYYSDCYTLKDSYKQDDRIIGLCARVVKYIKNKPYISNGEHLKDHHCNLLSYWIYEQLVSYYGNNSNETFHVFADILRVLSGLKYYLNNNKCELNSSIPIIPDRQEKKELYKYCIDYKTILEKSKHRKDQCNEYYKYVQKKIQLYKKYETFCSSSDKRNCPDFYENCKKNDPKVLLDQLKCKEEMLNEKQKPEDSPGTYSLGTTSSSFPRIQSVSNLGNAFLGVVVTSMTSGFLYKGKNSI
ncbi:hypothetical protein PVIIG_05365 [Plasmodium vivax India VII]|uniref:VIR protein n=1 Tax=Plasmodium vivax India VII TaxID=1077284 RepID=A0A0J9SHL8_PLAVI|nr:hypothetical protein PVIIG_05365 [Plasmodium vivax India VII]